MAKQKRLYSSILTSLPYTSCISILGISASECHWFYYARYISRSDLTTHRTCTTIPLFFARRSYHQTRCLGLHHRRWTAYRCSHSRRHDLLRDQYNVSYDHWAISDKDTSIFLQNVLIDMKISIIDIYWTYIAPKPKTVMFS